MTMVSTTSIMDKITHVLVTQDTVEGEDIEMEDDGTPRAKGKAAETDKHKAVCPVSIE